MNIKSHKKGLKTPQAQVSRPEVLKEGVKHWRVQRITAVALIPFGLWFIISVIHLGGADYRQARQWLASPFVGTGVILFMTLAFYHTYLGLQIIYEDYISRETFKSTAILLTGLVLLLAASLVTAAILSLSF